MDTKYKLTINHSFSHFEQSLCCACLNEFKHTFVTHGVVSVNIKKHVNVELSFLKPTPALNRFKRKIWTFNLAFLLVG